MPILTCNPEVLARAEIVHGDRVKVDFVTGNLTNLKSGKTVQVDKFYAAQLAIYKNGGLL
jgi:hypothetical protein